MQRNSTLETRKGEVNRLTTAIEDDGHLVIPYDEKSIDFKLEADLGASVKIVNSTGSKFTAMAEVIFGYSNNDDLVIKIDVRISLLSFIRQYNIF